MAERLAAPEFADYLMELGGTLLSYGCPTHRLEELIRELARIEGHRAEAFAVPTGLFLTVYGADGETPTFRMDRVKEWAVDLERLALVDGIFNEVAEHRCSLKDARRRLHELEVMPKPYPAVLQWLAPAGAAGAAAIFFRGGIGEVLVAAVGGLLLAVLAFEIRRAPRVRLLSDFLGGLIAAFLAWTVTSFQPDLSREVIVLSVVIVLVPGMALTTGFAELAHKNLVSGGARVFEAFIVFLSIMFGIALVVGIEQTVGVAHATPPVRVGAALPYQAIALLVAALSFAVIFSVPRKYLATAILSAAIAWIATAAGTRYLPGHMAAFGASLTLCLFANACARWTFRPAQVFQLPGMILLVPGSFGFLSLESFLRGEFLGGAAKGFEMVLIAGALVTGLLVANVVLPAKKIL